jgi:4-hydroxyphenylpyruvate dioxygenase
METSEKNPCGIQGIGFVELAPTPEMSADALGGLLAAFGFSRTHLHRSAQVDLYRQGQIRFLVNHQPGGFAQAFSQVHGPSISMLGLRVANPAAAFAAALERGAQAWEGRGVPYDAPAIFGLGGSLIAFIDDRFFQAFEPHPEALFVPENGFSVIDHLTNNVEKGTLTRWADFYKEVFGFTEVRSFDIRGERTGLYSFALRSPCGTFCIPINEGTEDKSQIEEYLREYHGPGIQHLAFLTDDLLGSLDRMTGGPVAFLDIDADYYRTVFERVPGVREDPRRIEAHQVLVDGDSEGYLLQIFTKNLIGPIFVELIQRRNHQSFGEGNFGALFRSIERDQERRGVL